MIKVEDVTPIVAKITPERRWFGRPRTWTVLPDGRLDLLRYEDGKPEWLLGLTMPWRTNLILTAGEWFRMPLGVAIGMTPVFAAHGTGRLIRGVPVAEVRLRWTEHEEGWEKARAVVLHEYLDRVERMGMAADRRLARTVRARFRTLK